LAAGAGAASAEKMHVGFEFRRPARGGAQPFWLFSHTIDRLLDATAAGGYPEPHANVKKGEVAATALERGKDY
jgi:hypothetical protein